MDPIDLLIYATIFLWRVYADHRLRRLIEEQQVKDASFRAQVNQRLSDLETAVID